MATCNTNGLLRHYVSPIISRSVSSHLSGPTRELFEFTDLKETKTTLTMAPRTVMEHNLTPVVPNGLIRSNLNVSNDLITKDTSEAVLDQPSPRGPLNTSKIATASSLTKASLPCPTHSRTEEYLNSRRKDHKRRLEACTKRFDVLRDKSFILMNRLLAVELPKSISTCTANSSELPLSISRLLDEEETESETDDESPGRLKTCSSLEENWLCTRAASCSDWQWLLSEIRRSDKCIRNLRLLRSSLQKWKSKVKLQEVECSSEDSCSRVTPFVSRDRSRHSYHDLASPKCARLIGELIKGSNDPHVRCSCIPHHTGPCILCCGVTPSDYVSPLDRPQCLDLLCCALPRGAHIHPKLSLPGDIQLSLRLESRLATPSNFTFREHKTTLHSIAQGDKPCCLKTPQKRPQRRTRRVNGFRPAREEIKSDLISIKQQEEVSRAPLSRVNSSITQFTSRSASTVSARSQCKAVNAPSALRRILNLAPDTEASMEPLSAPSRDCKTN